jgi:hypothetical protein
LDGQAHVRRGKLREHRAIDKFDHRVNDALRVNDDGDARHFYVEKPPSFDHFEAFIEERRGINRDFAAHDPRRMFQGAFDSDVGEIFFRCGAEGTTGSREPEFTDGSGGFAVETLKYGGMFAVDGKDADTMFAGFAHDDFAGHDENFLGGHGNIFARANGGESGAKAGSADDGNQDDVRVGHRGEFDEAIGAGQHIGGASELISQILSFGGINYGNGLRPMLDRLFEEINSPGAKEQANAVRGTSVTLSAGPIEPVLPRRTTFFIGTGLLEN